MFGQRSRYYPGPAGERFAWNVEPTFVCPLARSERSKGEEKRPIPTQEVRRAAQQLGCGVDELTRILKRAHQSFAHTRRRDAAGKLTDVCDCCGHKMDRLGFRVWIERPKTKDELTSADGVAAAINERLTGHEAVPMVTVDSRYLDTKREAKQWALDALQLARSAHEEAKAK